MFTARYGLNVYIQFTSKLVIEGLINGDLFRRQKRDSSFLRVLNREFSRCIGFFFLLKEEKIFSYFLPREYNVYRFWTGPKNERKYISDSVAVLDWDITLWWLNVKMNKTCWKFGPIFFFLQKLFELSPSHILSYIRNQQKAINKPRQTSDIFLLSMHLAIWEYFWPSYIRIFKV